MRRSIVIIAAIGCLMGASAAPEPPVSPQTKAECERFRSDYHSHLLNLQAASRDCMDANRSVPTLDWIPIDICGPIKINVPQACAEVQTQSSCDGSRFGILVNQCIAAIPQQPEADISTSILRSQADPNKSLAERAAIWAAKQSPTLRDVAKQYERFSNFRGNVTNLRTAVDSKAPISERTAAAVRLLNDAREGQPLSAEMLDRAIAAATQVNEDALTALMRELDKFSVDAADAARNKITTEQPSGTEPVVNEASEPEPELQETATSPAPFTPLGYIHQQYCGEAIRWAEACVLRSKGCDACEDRWDCNTEDGLSRALALCSPVCGLYPAGSGICDTKN